MACYASATVPSLQAPSPICHPACPGAPSGPERSVRERGLCRPIGRPPHLSFAATLFLVLAG